MRERRALEDALREHYRAAPGTDAAAPRALVEAVAAEMARPSRPRAAEVVAGQARRVGAGAWALPSWEQALPAAWVLRDGARGALHRRARRVRAAVWERPAARAEAEGRERAEARALPL